MATTSYVMENESTIRNLLAAYRGEMNTQARYRTFAGRADDDRLFGVASLFRAAARSEQIHANNQARAIRQLGGEATVAIEKSTVRSTLENLKDALDGENYEISTLYPRFIEEARARINATAARSFEWALEAERTHARLYAEAIALVKTNNRTSWIGEARDFYVCPVCAGTAEHKDSENCTICNYPSDRLEAIH
ncbi:MAG: rubrerythrin family protein [Terracidiphilus sp.]